MTDLERVVQRLEDDLEFDERGRIVGFESHGSSPRFVLGRAREGIVWRFRADVPDDLVRDVARLAGREKGIPIATTGVPRPPERWLSIERHFSVSAPFFSQGADSQAASVASRHTWITYGDHVVGELWSID